jgi:hypothetical protein
MSVARKRAVTAVMLRIFPSISPVFWLGFGV